MEILIFLLIIVIVVAVIIWVIKERSEILDIILAKKEKKYIKLPYFRKDYLITKAEIYFFRSLEKAVENKYYIFPEIRVSNLIYVKAEKKDFFNHRAKIKYKSVDFVLTNKTYLKPLLAIELDDSSHNYYKRIKRDKFIEKAFKDAGLPLLRVKCAYYYDVLKLKSQIEELIIGRREIKRLDETNTGINRERMVKGKNRIANKEGYKSILSEAISDVNNLFKK